MGGDNQFFYMKQDMFALKTHLMHRKQMRDAFINTRLLDACKVVVISRYRSQKNQGAVFLRENY